MPLRLSLVLFPLLVCCGPVSAQVIEKDLVHLRAGEEREWASFPERAQGERLVRAFQSSPNDEEWTLQLRQQDLKQVWQVKLNGATLGTLPRDECDMIVALPLPAGKLVEGKNELVIEARAPRGSDDVRVGEIVLHPRPMSEVFGEATLELTVLDEPSGRPLPSRITVVNAQGALQTVGASSGDHLAVRPGTLYTSTGKARFGLPAGEYTLYAGRGFEYSLARVEVSVTSNETVSKQLTIRREVPTEGYVACDTHVHTLTHSGHGDATVEERMITIAGEGIELPVAADHNVQVDHEPFARAAGVRKYFTPVIGNEVTTPVGHFNIFPVEPDAPVPNHQFEDWKELFDELEKTPGVRGIVLNHPRDLHRGVRPFGPRLYNALIAENLEGWPLGFNAMEVINSGATQTDVMRLFHDWMGLLNRGYRVTPVGSSDSHDVVRHFVGQGRTYVRVDDGDPGNIDRGQAAARFVEGQVLVSYGLLAELTVNEHGSGETAPVEGEEVSLSIRVLGPHWVEADRIQLFANGQLVREEEIGENRFAGSSNRAAKRPGVKWSAEWTIPRPKHDVHLVAIATGPGIDGPYWKTAKPYQPTSIHFEPRVIGCSGAVWLDVDGDGTSKSAREYAERLFEEFDGKLDSLAAALADYDAAVGAHIAHLYRTSGGVIDSDEFRGMLRSEVSSVREGFQAYFDAWRENEIARAQQ